MIILHRVMMISVRSFISFRFVSNQFDLYSLFFLSLLFVPFEEQNRCARCDAYSFMINKKNDTRKKTQATYTYSIMIAIAILQAAAFKKAICARSIFVLNTQDYDLSSMLMRVYV